MKLYISVLNALQDNQRGAAMPEYGLLVALIAVAAIVGVTAVGSSLQNTFTSIAGSIN